MTRNRISGPYSKFYESDSLNVLTQSVKGPGGVHKDVQRELDTPNFCLLSSTIQAVVPARLQIQNPQQLQIQSLEFEEIVSNECKIDSLSERGTTLVHVELTTFKWEALDPESSRPGADSDRCLKKGMKSIMQGSSNWGLVVQGGTTASYQCPRTSSNKTSFVDIQQVRINHINSLPNRQKTAIS